ncbi:unnamed protein product [Soboliphyme baturini]|uniref:Uncharacterized protein n=1 Tax=Soboliphyme baturini TaxID=241478 RepID=A0A183IN76_9BILA|nr:unnamed protein product [Soboliphyme baturini]
MLLPEFRVNLVILENLDALVHEVRQDQTGQRFLMDRQQGEVVKDVLVREVGQGNADQEVKWDSKVVMEKTEYVLLTVRTTEELFILEGERNGPGRNGYSCGFCRALKWNNDRVIRRTDGTDVSSSEVVGGRRQVCPHNLVLQVLVLTDHRLSSCPDFQPVLQLRYGKGTFALDAVTRCRTATLCLHCWTEEATTPMVHFLQLAA